MECRARKDAELKLSTRSRKYDTIFQVIVCVWRHPPGAVTPDSDPGSSLDSRVRGNDGTGAGISDRIVGNNINARSKK
jgi:hypothetical protein